MEGGKTAPFTCDMVIARYKEPLNWLPKYEKYNFRETIVYNKGPNDRKCELKGKKCKQIELKNEGRCDHTYLYHIIHNWDNLADVTIFTKGSSDMFRERRKLAFTVKRVFETNDTVMSVSHHSTPIHIDAGSFQMDMYRSSNPINHNGILDTETLIMKKADIRPFGKWYDAHFPGIHVTKAVYSGVFAVSKKHIHQHQKSYYEKLIRELEGHPNPEAGHYFERSWVAIFHPIPEECMYHDIFHDIFEGGAKRNVRRGSKKRITRRIKRSRSYSSRRA